MLTILVIGRSRFFTRYFQQTQIFVGRALDNDVVLPGLAVSRRHCCITADQQGFFIEDLSSTNGCYVNGFIVNGSSPVLLNDEIYIGAYTLYLQRGQVDLKSYLHRQQTAACERSDDTASWAMAAPSVLSSSAATDPSLRRWASDSTLAPSRGMLRRLIDRVLVSASDLDAFCLDHFPQVRLRFTTNMDRVSKVNLLLERVPPGAILRRLREDYPELSESYPDLLGYEGL